MFFSLGSHVVVSMNRDTVGKFMRKFAFTMSLSLLQQLVDNRVAALVYSHIVYDALGN